MKETVLTKAIKGIEKFKYNGRGDVAGIHNSALEIAKQVVISLLEEEMEDLKKAYRLGDNDCLTDSIRDCDMAFNKNFTQYKA